MHFGNGAVRRGTLTLAIALCGHVAVVAQTVLERELAILSQDRPAAAVWETSLAVGAERVIAISHVWSSFTDVAIGYAIATPDPNGNWNWEEEGLIDPNEVGRFSDPSIAYDSVSGDFLVCAAHFDEPQRIVVARYDSTTSTFGGWQTVFQVDPNDPNHPALIDKPWIVAGEVITNAPCLPPGGSSLLDPERPEAQEFYITWATVDEPLRMQYRRSMDGGLTWTGADARFDVGDPNTYVPLGFFWSIPRVYGSRPLYVACLMDDFGPVQFVRGLDQPCGEVEYTQLLDGDTGGAQPLALEFNVRRKGVQDRLPRIHGDLNRPPGFGIDMAVDPTQSDKLYVVYHDTATPEPADKDMNIYFQAFKRVPGSQGVQWKLHTGPVQVNDDDTDFEADQFTPMIDVDDAGGIHVIFYDDRNFTDPEDPNDGDQQTDLSQLGKFDVFYAYSDDGGANWTNLELFEIPSEPACDLDPNLVDFTRFQFRDYIGIDCGTDRVFTSFWGSTNQDENAEKTVIWSSEILLPTP